MSKGRRVALGRASDDALELVSFGRGAPRAFTPRQIEQLRLTVNRAPEVMVKVSGGGKDAGGVEAHLRYLDRKGELDIETDDGRVLQGEGAARALIEDWNLDIRTKPAARREGERPPPKQAHNLVLSMPRRTDPQTLLDAVRGFAEKQFAERHRYALVLHTDKDHPHVHLVVKAVGVEGERLYIRKATLREWRAEFAQELRDRGIPANATNRTVRGQTRTGRPASLEQARRNGHSMLQAERERQIAIEVAQGTLTPGPGKQRLIDTRAAVLAGWLKVAGQLKTQGEERLARDVERFARSMPPPRTDKEHQAAELLAKIASRDRGARAIEARSRSR